MGLITDGTGSAVPDAALTVSSASTSLQRTTKSNAYGRYFVPYLTPGKYELGVSKNAFKKAVVSAITLEVHQTARVDVSLEVGDIETTITVEAPAAATLQSDNTTVGGDIEQRALEELPGRDVFTSLSLSTNVANLRMHGFNGNVLSGLQPGSNRFLSANMNFGGQRQTANYYWLDGLSNTNWNINSMTNTPSVESLQEARVQVSTSSQQFGQAPGGIINVVTRAGTNDFHGEVYNYLRNDALDARPYNFSSEVQPKAPLRHNQFGASFGGQLINDKVFFFAHYEGLEARSRQEGSASPPTRRAREGDLTDYGRTIYDPLSASGGFRTPFPNNTIPRNRFSPVANKYLEFTPLPNVPGEIQRNFLGQRPSRTHNNQGNLRIDTQLARTDWLNGAFHVNDQKQNVEDVYNGITGTSTRTRAWNATLNETHVFSPSLINNFKIGYNRLVAVDGVYSEFRRDIIGELGIEGINRDPANWGFPSVFVSSIGFPVDSAQRPINQRDNLYHVLNDVTLLTADAQRRILVITDYSDSPIRPRRRVAGLGRLAAECCEAAVFVGERAHFGTRDAIASGMPPENAHAFPDLASAAEFLMKELRAGDLVLLRGRVTDHVTRIFFAQLGEVKCWKTTCPKTMLCDICPELGTPKEVRRQAVPVPPHEAGTEPYEPQSSAPARREPDAGS